MGPRPGPSGCREREPGIAVGGELVAVLPVGPDAADVGHEHPRLAGHVGAHVPGVGLRVERVVADLADVVGPGPLGLLGGLDDGVPALVGVVDGVGDKSTCCSIDTIMFDSTDGLPGPVIV